MGSNARNVEIPISKIRSFRLWRTARRRALQARNRPGLQRLKLAHKLMESEKYSQAGIIFEELGVAAISRGIPRAPQLFLQAGRAQVLAGAATHGTDLLIKGTRLMSKMGQTDRLPIVSRRILSELRESSMDQEYRILENEFRRLLSELDLKIAHNNRVESHSRLPSKCPYCGGTINPDEVDWINNHSATCDYCGSVVEINI